MKWFKLAVSFLFAAAFFAAMPLFAEAEGESLSVSLSPSIPRLTDKSESTRASVTELTLDSETPMDSLYIIYFQTPTAFSVSDGEKSVEVQAEYLRQFVSVSQLLGEGKSHLTLSFASSVELLEVYAFAGEVPSWVQIWDAPCERADLCLMTSHADDEQLFFAGILPYYAGELGYQVQVIYFTDHVNEPLRRHELLCGLWTVGVEHYPVISPFPDLYSESEAVAENQFSARGFSRETVVGFQVEMLRRFKPLVVVGHDPKGEYGHGQHRLNSSTLQEAVQISGDANRYPESAELFGTWEVPKTYLHLYEENQILMDWDIPLEAFGGKTAFEMTKEGFLCHASQQYTWFRRWLNGSYNQILKASEINTYSPCRYGLFLSRVGEDMEKNDFFENLKTWEEQRLEQEALQRAKEEAERLAREEAERLAAEEKARQEALRAEEEARLEAERLAAEKKKKIAVLSFVAGAVLAAVAILFALFFKKRKKKDPVG